MSTVDLVLLASIFTNGFVVLGGFAYWLAYRQRRSVRADVLADVEVHLRELRAANEALTLEVERLGEGQRFVAQMLLERGARPTDRPREPGRSITPH